MAEPGEVFAARVRAAIAAWGEDIAHLVESSEGFSLALQAKWLRFIGEAMPQQTLTGQDQLNDDQIGQLLIAAIVEVVADLDDELKE
jgi:hypothetical protein